MPASAFEFSPERRQDGGADGEFIVVGYCGGCAVAGKVWDKEGCRLGEEGDEVAPSRSLSALEECGAVEAYRYDDWG
jgi:hypothetical protein